MLNHNTMAPLLPPQWHKTDGVVSCISPVIIRLNIAQTSEIIICYTEGHFVQQASCYKPSDNALIIPSILLRISDSCLAFNNLGKSMRVEHALPPDGHLATVAFAVLAQLCGR